MTEHSRKLERAAAVAERAEAGDVTLTATEVQAAIQGLAASVSAAFTVVAQVIEQVVDAVVQAFTPIRLALMDDDAWADTWAEDYAISCMGVTEVDIRRTVVADGTLTVTEWNRLTHQAPVPTVAAWARAQFAAMP